MMKDRRGKRGERVRSCLLASRGGHGRLNVKLTSWIFFKKQDCILKFGCVQSIDAFTRLFIQTLKHQALGQITALSDQIIQVTH